MTWKELMKTAYEEPMFNWKLTLSGIDAEKFKSMYLDPAPGYTGVVRCPECKNCDQQECHGLYIRDLLTGTTACCSKRYSGPKIPVSKDDTIRYSLSYPRFHADVCRRLGLNMSNTSMGDFFWELGTYKRGAGRFLPVYISYYITQAQLTEKLKDLLADSKAQFALILFDHSMISRPMAKLLEERKCICVSMGELLTMESDCSLTQQTNPEYVFNIYKEDEHTISLQTYSCTPGTKWSDIHINWLDRETLSVWKRGETPIAVSYVALGMASGKNNKPNKGFRFLSATLESSKDSLPVPAKSTKEYQTLVQRKREINNTLKAFFPDIKDGDPIEFDSRINSYVFRFQSRAF